MPEMTHYVIYDHPKDCPGHWVVRRWFIGKKGEAITVWPAKVGIACDTLEEARATVPTGFVNVGRSFEGDPVIAEVWI